MRRFGFAIGAVDVEVASDLPEVIDDLAAMYGPGAPGRRDPIRVEVTGRRRYAVLGDGEVFGAGIRRREVLPYVEWAVNWRVIARSAGRLLVHAASMSRDGQGVVFAGDSGAGKSTLVAGLLARGWRYLCDEFAMIDVRTRRLLPFPKAVCVKAGAFDLVRRLDLRLHGERRYVKALKGTVGYLSPRDVPAGSPCPVRGVVFCRYTGHPEARLRPVGGAKAAFMLTAHGLNRHVLGLRAAATASRITRDARCAVLETGDLNQACDLIETLVC